MTSKTNDREKMPNAGRGTSPSAATSPPQYNIHTYAVQTQPHRNREAKRWRGGGGGETKQVQHELRVRSECVHG